MLTLAIPKSTETASNSSPLLGISNRLRSKPREEATPSRQPVQVKEESKEDKRKRRDLEQLEKELLEMQHILKLKEKELYLKEQELNEIEQRSTRSPPSIRSQTIEVMVSTLLR